jgi:hypothetical protein
MMTTEETEPRKTAVGTNIQHYGNNTSMDGACSEAALPTSLWLEGDFTVANLATNEILREET